MRLAYDGLQQAVPEVRPFNKHCPALAHQTQSTSAGSQSLLQHLFVLIVHPLCMHALLQVVVDTSGWAFTYPLYRLASVKVASYTHYPVISTDMLQRVVSRRAAFNNDASVAASPLRSAVKLVYYYLFAAAYGAMGGCANVSSHTPRLSLHMHSQKVVHTTDARRHVCEGEGEAACAMVAGGDGELHLDARAHSKPVVDPAQATDSVPTVQRCSTGSPSVGQEAEVPVHGFIGAGMSQYLFSSGWALLLSVHGAAVQCPSWPVNDMGDARAQFRPEKNHAMQLRAFALARQRAGSSAVWSGSSEAVLAARMKLIGSCRDAGDERRVEQLVTLHCCTSIERDVLLV